MGRFIRAWAETVASLHPEAAQVSDTELSRVPTELLPLVLACHDRTVAIHLHENLELLTPTLADVAKRKKFVVAREYGEKIKVGWKDDAVLVDGVPLEQFLQRGAVDAKWAPDPFKRAMGEHNVLKQVFADDARLESAREKADAEDSAGRVGFWPVSASAAPEFPRGTTHLSGTQFGIHRHDEERPRGSALSVPGEGGELVLNGWWLAGAVELTDGDIAGLTLTRDTVKVDIDHPDLVDFPAAASLRAEGFSGVVDAVSNGALHIVAANGGYRANIVIDAESVSATQDGRFVALRRSSPKFANRWGTVVLAVRDGHVWPVAKTHYDLGPIFESDGKVYLLAPADSDVIEGWSPYDDNPAPRGAFELRGLDAVAKLEPWTVRKIADDLPMEERPEVLAEITFVDGEDSLLHLEAVNDAALSREVSSEALRAELSAHFGHLHLVGSAPFDGGAYAMFAVWKAEMFLVRFEGKLGALKPVFGMPIVGLGHISTDSAGRLLTLSSLNAGEDLAYSLAFTFEDSKPKYLGRAHGTVVAIGTAGDRNLVEFEHHGRYAIANLADSLKQLSEEQRPIAVAYDAETGFGRRTFVVRRDADWGYVRPDGTYSCREQFTRAYDFNEGLGRAQWNFRFFGLVDSDGETVLPPAFSWIGGDMEGYRTIARGEPNITGDLPKPEQTKWGLLGPDLNVTIPCLYDAMIGPTDGIIGFRSGGKYQVFGVDGAVLTGEFQNMRGIADGYAAVQVADQWGVINTAGEMVCEPRFVNACAVGSRLIPVQLEPDGPYQYLDPSKDELLEGEYEGWTSHIEGFACVRVGDLWGHLDAKGELFGAGLAYKRTYRFTGEMAQVELVNGAWSYVNRDGELLSADGWLRAFAPSEGVAFVELEAGTYGLVNSSGEVFAENLAGGLGMSEGLSPAKCKSAGLWGYLDIEGKWAIKPKFDAASGFSNSLAAAKQGDRWGFINREGEFAIAPQYGSVGRFIDGPAPVKRPFVKAS